jgi:hypothetical protein
MTGIEITVFHKADGALSKLITLEDGAVHADGSECRMAVGTARRVKLNGVTSLAQLIDRMPCDQALALGRLRPGLADNVRVIAKRKLDGATPADTIARSGDYLLFAPGQPAYLLLDHDGKGMPDEVRSKLTAGGGFWPALTAVVPGLAGAARVHRRSTSAGLYHAPTGKKLGGSSNCHVYVMVKDGSDSKRTLETLRDRLWLAGYGYFVVGRIGQLLDRAIIDAAVYGPERLVFEGEAVVVAPLAQDRAARRPLAYDGAVIDTVQAIPALSAAEAQQLAELKDEAKRRLQAAADAARRTWAREFAARRGLSEQDAERIATQAINHILEREFELEFDDPDLGSCTVGDVLDNPERYRNATLADPLEGVGYGRDKAKVLRRRDGRLMIHSFAHGGINYRLAGQYGGEDRLERIIHDGENGEFDGDCGAAESYVITEMLRRGYGSERIRDAITDPDNGISAKSREQGDPQVYAEQQISRAIANIDFDGDGRRIFQTPDNIRIALLKLGVRLRHDQFSLRDFIDGLPEFGPALDDAALTRVWMLMDQRFGFRPPIDRCDKRHCAPQRVSSGARLPRRAAMGRRRAHRQLAEQVRRRRRQ